MQHKAHEVGSLLTDQPGKALPLGHPSHMPASQPISCLRVYTGSSHLKLSGEDELGGVDDGSGGGAGGEMVQLASQKRPVLLIKVWPGQKSAFQKAAF